MKLPTEGELIEIENRGLKLISDRQAHIRKTIGDSTLPYALERELDEWGKFKDDFTFLIAMIRNRLQLERLYPRTSVSKPSSTSAAKQKRKK